MGKKKLLQQRLNIGFRDIIVRCRYVIGKFSGVGEVKTTKAGNSWMTIYLENIRKEKLACSVWNDYVGLVEAYVDGCNRSTETAIIVIRCVQRCQWEGEVRVTTTRYATRFYLNHAIPEVEAFIGELHNGEEPSESNVISYISSESDDMLSRYNLSTITEIKKCQKAGKYVTVATIYDVDLNVKWYYDNCKHCTTNALKNDEGRWVCKRAKCIGSTEGSDTSIPRYHVKFRVIGTDNEVSEFVIFETQITSFTKVSAANMVSALEQVIRGSPPKVQLGAKFKVIYSMSDDQDIVGRWATKYLDIKADWGNQGPDNYSYYLTGKLLKRPDNNSRVA
ncbi:uncharacterized protein LOC141587717 [Silene latifolia]|uniref:uncharacterized protein LOC141587717 n=1 Tax=Silene latifolia TaxID=37657 RepID=UPI003D76C229